MRRVEVFWVDSLGLNDGRWAEREEHEEWLDIEALVVHSVGYVYSENDDLLMLAGSVNEEVGVAAEVQIIPKVAIRKLVELTEKRRR